MGRWRREGEGGRGAGKRGWTKDVRRKGGVRREGRRVKGGKEEGKGRWREGRKNGWRKEEKGKKGRCRGKKDGRKGEGEKRPSPFFVPS